MWRPCQQQPFEASKQAQDSITMLRQLDSRPPFQLHTYWSMLGIGVVLTKNDDDKKECVIDCASQSENDANANYESYEGECLTVVWAVTHCGA